MVTIHGTRNKSLAIPYIPSHGLPDVVEGENCIWVRPFSSSTFRGNLPTLPNSLSHTSHTRTFSKKTSQKSQNLRKYPVAVLGTMPWLQYVRHWYCHYHRVVLTLYFSNFPTIPQYSETVVVVLNALLQLLWVSQCPFLFSQCSLEWSRLRFK
jgi:hypothetical protein